MDNQQEDDLIFNLLLIGDSGVGKTTLLKGFFDGKSEPSTCIKLTVETAMISKNAHTHLCDTSGFKPEKLEECIGEADGIMLIFDVTNKLSYQSIQKLMALIKETAPPFARLMIIGNKTDLKEQRVVSAQRGDDLASLAACQTGRKSLYYETSSVNPDKRKALFILCNGIFYGMVYHHQLLAGEDGFVFKEENKSASGKTRS